ncbi:hypothetical protein [Corticimicrobacter populi]|uniref:DUF5666 domain-containing protein n=1 Tax=Corticimicrobacter populi TaxID=2175229 RepID=A0A2V1K361_9BURK|nr:hypothetical protein [Corticimicrobacter populi]PWF25030.1 hypothetical protein DD235_02340 [Corticimicrobacter populi]
MKVKRLGAWAAGACALSLLSAVAVAGDIVVKVESEQYPSGTHTVSVRDDGSFNDTVTFQQPGPSFDPRCANAAVGADGKSHNKVSLSINGFRGDDGIVLIDVVMETEKAGRLYDRGVVAPDGRSMTTVECPSVATLMVGPSGIVRPGQSIVLFDGMDGSDHSQVKLTVDLLK